MEVLVFCGITATLFLVMYFAEKYSCGGWTVRPVISLILAGIVLTPILFFGFWYVVVLVNTRIK